MGAERNLIPKAAPKLIRNPVDLTQKGSDNIIITAAKHIPDRLSLEFNVQRLINADLVTDSVHPVRNPRIMITMV